MSSNVTKWNWKIFHDIWRHLINSIRSETDQNSHQFHVTIQMSWKIFQLTWWHFIACGDFSRQSHVIYHDMSWQVMKWLSDSERPKETLEADRLHPCNYLHTPTDYRHTEKHLRLVMRVVTLCCTRQSRASYFDRCVPEIWPCLLGHTRGARGKVTRHLAFDKCRRGKGDWTY